MFSGIVIIWLVIPTFVITMECVSTDIDEEFCMPGVHGDIEQADHFSGFFVAYLLPLTLMTYFYSRLIYALRPKV